MKDQSEQLEEELIGKWDSSKPLPDQIYFIKVFKRNLVWLLLGGVLTLVAAWFLPRLANNTYRSSVFAIFDHVDVSGSGMGTSPQVGYNTVARLFKARFQSQDFLNEIVKRVGGRDTFLSESFIEQWIEPIKARLRLPSQKTETSEDEKIQLAAVLAKMLDPYPEPESGVLALHAYTESPKLSQDLANQAMELFIRKELEEQIKSLDIKLNFLQKNVSKMPTPPRRVAPRPRVNKAERVASMRIEDRIRELEDRLRTLNAQVDANRIEKDQTLTDIQRELVRLQTNLQPNHPQVIEKRKEIELIRQQFESNEAKLSGELERVRRQLSAQRSSRTIIVEEEMPMEEPSPDPYQGNFMVAVNDRVKDIELERKNLQRQVEDPSLRTRIRIIFPATYEPLPYSNQRRNMRYATLLFGAALTFFFVIWREFRNKKARDAWRIERSSGKTLIAQISQKSATEFSNISPRLADQLRTHLSKINKVDEPARTLLSYRRLELAMLKNCQGRCILLVNAGPFDETAQVVKNFLNIYATDHQDDFLLIDCNLQDPVYKHISKGGPDLVDFLEGRAAFEDVVIERAQLDGFAFDVLPPMNKFSGKKTRSFREDTIQTVLARVPSKYKQIFIRSMPEMHFIENMALLRASSDAFIFIDANRTHYFDLQRTLTHLESDKIRGLVALGT